MCCKSLLSCEVHIPAMSIFQSVILPIFPGLATFVSFDNSKIFIGFITSVMVISGHVFRFVALCVHHDFICAVA